MTFSIHLCPYGIIERVKIGRGGWPFLRCNVARQIFSTPILSGIGFMSWRRILMEGLIGITIHLLVVGIDNAFENAQLIIFGVYFLTRFYENQWKLAFFGHLTPDHDFLSVWKPWTVLRCWEISSKDVAYMRTFCLLKRCYTLKSFSSENTRLPKSWSPNSSSRAFDLSTLSNRDYE